MSKIAPLALAALLLVTTDASATRPTKGRPTKTGQTITYGPGSDGDLQRGLSPMFNDLGNGVVKDQRTGLFWEKKSNDESIHDKDFKYTWGQEALPSEAKLPGANAVVSMNGTMITVFLAALNTPPCFAGFCDWRIPNRRELDTLLDFGRYNPATFAEFNTGCAPGCTVTTCSCTLSAGYWTSSTYRDYPVSAWLVDFLAGSNYTDGKTTGYYVRAVRGGS